MTDELIEYRVKPVTRHIVTRFEKSEKGCSIGSVGRGEFDNSETAYEVAYAMAKADQERKGWPLGDPRIQYPRHPQEETCQPCPEPVPDYDGKMHALSAIEREYHRINGLLCDNHPRYVEAYAAQQALAWAMDASCAQSPFKYLTEGPPAVQPSA